MIFMATMPLPALAASSITAVITGSMVKLYAVRMTSIFSCFARNGISSGWPPWVLTPAKADLSSLLGDLLRLNELVGDVRGPGLAVQIPDVDVSPCRVL